MSVVSILIPTFNRESFLGEAIESALAQTFSDIEVVVVDNCSDDGTYGLAQKYSQLDRRVRAFQNKENVGPVRNWICCAQLAKSPYSKLLFSDDLIAPDYIESTLPYLVSDKCGFVYTPAIIGAEAWVGNVNYRAFSSDTKITKNTFVITSLRCGPIGLFPLSPGAALFRTKDLLANMRTELPGVVDFDFSRIGAGVDWLTYMLTALSYDHVQYIDGPLCFFRSHENSFSTKDRGELLVAQSLAQQWLSQALGLST